jgi:hypothetical protein
MVADSKKVQSLINLIATEAEALKASSIRLEALKAKFVAQNPDVTDTPLQGNVGAVNTWLADLKAVADSPVADGMIAARVKSHRGTALDG